MTRPVKLHAWGGLAAQLSSLAYALWILENHDRPVLIAFHTGGTSHRSFAIEPLVRVAREEWALPLNFEIIDDWSDAPSSASGIRQLGRLPELGRRRMQLVRSRLSSKTIHRPIIMRSDLTDLLRSQTEIIGYPLDWTIATQMADAIGDLLASTTLPNFLRGAGEDGFIAVHWRLGDYLDHPDARATHGIVPPESLMQAVDTKFSDASLSVVVYTDSPQRALELFSQTPCTRPMEFRSGDIWNDLFDMSRTSNFLGSHSAVSFWVATAIRQANPEASVFLPDRWFRTTPRGMGHVPPPPFPTYSTSLR